MILNLIFRFSIAIVRSFDIMYYNSYEALLFVVIGKKRKKKKTLINCGIAKFHETYWPIVLVFLVSVL